MKNSNDVIYEMTIDGCLYRGTRDELSQIIADYRENHDQPSCVPTPLGSWDASFYSTFHSNFVSLMNREEALATASKYCLENEVAYAIDNLGLDPYEALAEWDIL